MLLAFEGLLRPVALIDCDELADGFAAVLRGWPFALVDPAPDSPPVITLRRTAQGYRHESEWQETPPVFPDPVDAVCNFLVDLLRAYVADDRTLLCLHSAAAEFAGRLVVFPSDYRAGKSTLSAYLAAAGVRLYADDVLPIKEDDNRGVAPGILPRLRLPLPPEAAADFRDYVSRHKGIANERALYLDLDADALAQHGEQAPIGGFVLLDREAGAPAELKPLGKSEMLKRVILRNFAREVEPVDILERLHALVDAGPSYVLRYGGGAEAAALLKETFRVWRSPLRGVSVPRRAKAGSDVSGDAASPTPGGRIRRRPDIVERRVEDELFLVNPEGEAIFHLNVLGAALWRLLAEPTLPEEVAALVHQAFPEVPAPSIERDVGAVLADFAARGLVVGSPAETLPDAGKPRPTRRKTSRGRSRRSRG
ncbi:MAG: PqqD family protein [Alphaproteobacteria bacterium]